MQVGKGATRMKGRTDAQCLDNGHVAIFKSEDFRESLEVQAKGSARDFEDLNLRSNEIGPAEIVSFFGKMNKMI